jgi:hypothetical protein
MQPKLSRAQYAHAHVVPTNHQALLVEHLLASRRYQNASGLPIPDGRQPRLTRQTDF